MKTSRLCFSNYASAITLQTYHSLQKKSVLLSAIVTRIASVALFSLAGALDVVFHTLMILPTFAYSASRWIIFRQGDFLLPWQHLQRVQNAIPVFLFGSVLGIFHPYAAVTVAEPTDKHIAIGMLSSNIRPEIETICSPIHSLCITEEIFKEQLASPKKSQKSLAFDSDHLELLQEIKKTESFLEALQAQEFIQKITNLTLAILASTIESIYVSYGDSIQAKVITRLCFFLIPVLSLLDFTIAALAHIFFLACGFSRFISGRGPVYTETTTHLFMHVTFLAQNLLKVTANLLSSLIWLIDPGTAFYCSLIPSNMFFKIQLKVLCNQIHNKLCSAHEGSCLVVPIVFGEGEASALSIPTHNMHKTYLIIEKKEGRFNLYWVNRPSVEIKNGLNLLEVEKITRSMISERFPFMNIQKILNYPVMADKPQFPQPDHHWQIESQGNQTNCVVSNLFGMFEIFDRIQGKDPKTPLHRHKAVRESLIKNYSFYKSDFSPLGSSEELWDSDPSQITLTI